MSGADRGFARQLEQFLRYGLHKQVGIAAAEVRTAHAFAEESVAREDCLQIFREERDAARRMARRVDELEFPALECRRRFRQVRYGRVDG